MACLELRDRLPRGGTTHNGPGPPISEASRSEFEASLVYRASSRIGLHREILTLKKKEKKNKENARWPDLLEVFSQSELSLDHSLCQGDIKLASTTASQSSCRVVHRSLIHI